MKRAEQKEKRRQEILNVGLNMFIKKGYTATRTADIAKAVGMSEGLLFHYFETKEKLYLALIEIAVQGKDNVMGFENIEIEPLNFFEKTAETIISYIIKEPFAAKLFVLMNQAQYNEVLFDKISGKLMRQSDIELSVGLIKKGQETGTIREGDPLALAFTFWTAIQGTAENIARNPKIPSPKPEWIADILRRK